MTTHTLTLASASPRRAALLRDAGIDFVVAPAHVDEAILPGERAIAAALRLAESKARAVDAPLVLGADTIGEIAAPAGRGSSATAVADLDARILGKPRDAADARAMLAALSGRAHVVVTGVALREGARVRLGFAQTRVHFREIDAREISDYVATGEPLDKAGSYAIQGGARGFVERIEGPLDNVVGLPVRVVRELMRAADAV